MKIRVLDEAEDDLHEGREFYERREPGIGGYFAASLAADLDSLQIFAGIHPVVLSYHRALSKRFPFAIYYRVEEGIVSVYAVLDLRRDPAWIRRRLGKT